MAAFWMGHRMLGDVIGFCAAAHLFADRSGQSIKVWFDDQRSAVCQYFDGVEWVPRDQIPDAIDCGIDPNPDEWPQLNGVTRFYRHMDGSLSPRKSLDIHFNRPRRESDASSEKLIGLITHSQTQGDIDPRVLAEMLEEAKRLYPDHRICAFGNMDNVQLPPGVEDWRQSGSDIEWVIELVRRLDLLITPQSGPCFIAAGWRVPVWVYRSRAAHWDWTLNYESYKVDRWWNNTQSCETEAFCRIYGNGGWNGMGSGPGSTPETCGQFIQFLSSLLETTPGIRSVLDIGCGDWQVMQHVNLGKCRYHGVDVVPELMVRNRKRFANSQVTFEVRDVTCESLPHADLIIIKDVLQHLPGTCISRILSKIRHACRFALIVNDFTAANVGDIRSGEWRPVNVLEDPYSLNGATIGIWNGKHVSLSEFSPAREITGIRPPEHHSAAFEVCSRQHSLASQLQPAKLPSPPGVIPLVRLGRRMDGGYLIPGATDSSLSDIINAHLRIPLVSFGAGWDVSFEIDWARHTGQSVVVYDNGISVEQFHTLVQHCPQFSHLLHFRPLAAQLCHGRPLAEDCTLFNSESGWALKMDIEGGEYQILEEHGRLLGSLMSACRLMVMELHWLSQSAWYHRAINLLKILHRDWLLVHSHGNNYSSLWRESRGRLIPDVVELTWLHRSLLPAGFRDTPCPIPRPIPCVDYPNDPRQKDHYWLAPEGAVL